MNYIILIIGVVVTGLGSLSLDLLIIGLALIFVSFFMHSKPKPKDTTEKPKKISIIDKLDKVKFEPFHEDALSNAISDTVAVTAKMAQGKNADVSTKTLVKGTFGVVEGVEKIIK